MVACWAGWQAVQALTQVNHYWGVVTIGWVPIAGMATASIGAIMSIFLWYMTDSKSKPGLLGGQLCMQVLCIFCALLAMMCWAHPNKVDPHVSRPACAQQCRTVAATAWCLC